MFRKNKKIIFKDRIEIILSQKGDNINGYVKTDKNEYSKDFLKRWLNFGFIKIE
jgi:protein associated with RNAse G/E